MFLTDKKYIYVVITVSALNCVLLVASDNASSESHEAKVLRKREIARKFRDETGKSPCLSCSAGSDESDRSIEQQPVMNPLNIQHFDAIDEAEAVGVAAIAQAEAARLAEVVGQWQADIDSSSQSSGCCSWLASLYTLYCGCCCCGSCFRS